jgi:hypothetical protein
MFSHSRPSGPRGSPDCAPRADERAYGSSGERLQDVAFFSAGRVSSLRPARSGRRSPSSSSRTEPRLVADHRRPVLVLNHVRDQLVINLRSHDNISMFLAKWLRNTSIVPAGIMLPPLAPAVAFSFPSYDRNRTGEEHSEPSCPEIKLQLLQRFPMNLYCY